jgi:dCMP deaminase
MKPKFQKLYNNIAHEVAKMSHARRLQVGAVIVKDDRVISMGYNGMPAGWENNCEFKNYDLSRDFDGNYFANSYKEYPFEDERGRYKLQTRPEVLHAEMNSLMKLAKSTESGEDASMIVTHAPCMECAKGIFQAGIKEVFYREDYRSTDGINFLKNCGIKIEKLEF